MLDPDRRISGQGVAALRDANIGGISDASGYTPSGNLCLRITTDEPLDVVELSVVEDGLGAWKLEGITTPDGRWLHLPLRIANAAEVWVRNTSPVTYANKRSLPEFGRFTLRIRDHTQKPGDFHVFDLSQLIGSYKHE